MYPATDAGPYQLFGITTKRICEDSIMLQADAQRRIGVGLD
jgi:hypothetical protein